jgi:uncharacterized protein YrrD
VTGDLEDLGRPVAYTGLEEGTPVYDRDGDRVGVVEHVQAAMDQDIFEGLIIHTTPLPGRHVYADADQIDEMYERGVLLSVDAGELQEPPEPASRRRRKGQRSTPESPLEARLRHAWDWLAGRR